MAYSTTRTVQQNQYLISQSVPRDIALDLYKSGQLADAVALDSDLKSYDIISKSEKEEIIENLTPPDLSVDNLQVIQGFEREGKYRTWSLSSSLVSNPGQPLKWKDHKINESLIPDKAYVGNKLFKVLYEELATGQKSFITKPWLYLQMDLNAPGWLILMAGIGLVSIAASGFFLTK